VLTQAQEAKEDGALVLLYQNGKEKQNQQKEM